MKRILVCIDRDGTLIDDTKEHLYLGRENDWKDKVKILPFVIDGIKAMNEIPDSAVFMTTNQSGVAISDFPLLTEERAHEVCKYVIMEIEKLGGRIDGYVLCPHVTRSYVESHKQYHFDERFVCDCDCIKPGSGLVSKALEYAGANPEDTHVFIIGDRVSDVMTAVNMGGTGILVPFANQPGEEEKVRSLPDQSRIHIAPNLLKAAEFIEQTLRLAKR